MAIVPLPAGKLNMDKGPSPGDHLWVVKDALVTESGYEKLPEWSQTVTQSVTSGYLPYGAHCWRGGYTGRMYIATNDKLWEASDSAVTDVTGSALTNATNGVTFASYGDWEFASNGVDDIQAIRVPSALASSTNFAAMVPTTGGARFAAKYICSHKNHLVAANLKFLESYGEIASFTTPAGANFPSANQPNGDSIQIYGDAADTAGAGKYVTVYGTYTGGGDTVAAEQILINGAAAVTSSRVNWEKILGMNSSFEPTLITARKTIGGLVFASFTTSVGVGIEEVTAGQTSGGDQLLDIVASDTTTRVIGIIGTSELGVAQWDSQELTGATTVQSNSRFRTFTHILTGNLEATRTVTVSAHAYAVNQEEPYLVWWSGTDDPEGFGTEVYAPQIVGSSNQPLLDGVGKITGVADGGDCFFVFKEGCIYRFDGPPFSPTLISGSWGMRHGNVPFKQGNRIYFWADCGLCYIDISTNAIERPMSGFVQRSVVDYANANYQSLSGGFPTSRVSSVQYSNAVNTSGVASITGDGINSLIYVLYTNASAAGTHGFIYNENMDSFVQVTGPASSNATGTYVVDYKASSYGIPGVLSNIRCISFAGATTFQIQKMTTGGFATTTTRDLYMRWPFHSGQAGGSKSRILRVRPIFDNPVATASAAVFNIRVEVVSISGVQKSWKNHGIFSLGNGTLSLDGWITVDGCPYADKHSIGVSVLSTASHTGTDPFLSNFVGIEVDTQTAVLKSI